jgi:hypothetical protein
MPRLNRCYGHGFLPFITFSCYHRLPLFQQETRRDLFLRILEQVRKSYRFVVEKLHYMHQNPGERGDEGACDSPEQFAGSVEIHLQAG